MKAPQVGAPWGMTSNTPAVNKGAITLSAADHYQASAAGLARTANVWMAAIRSGGQPQRPAKSGLSKLLTGIAANCHHYDGQRR